MLRYEINPGGWCKRTFIRCVVILTIVAYNLILRGKNQAK